MVMTDYGWPSYKPYVLYAIFNVLYVSCMLYHDNDMCGLYWYTDGLIHSMYIYSPGTVFTTVSPTLIRKITFSSRLAVVLVWSVPTSVADDVDGFVISVVMVTARGPKTIQRTTVSKHVRAYGVHFPEKGASYQVTVHMIMNSRPLTVEVNF